VSLGASAKRQARVARAEPQGEFASLSWALKLARMLARSNHEQANKDHHEAAVRSEISVQFLGACRSRKGLRLAVANGQA